MAGKEAHDKFMAEIQKSIEAADRSSKEKAENILKSISDSYRDKVIAALTNAKTWRQKQEELAIP